MKRSVYIAGFVLVLLTACVAGVVGGRLLLNRLQQDFGIREEWTPAPTSAVAVVASETSTPDVLPAPEATATRPPATVLVVPAPVTDQPPLLSTAPEPTWTPGVALPTTSFVPLEQLGQGDGTATPEPSATPIPAYPYTLARSVRYSNGDCPGTYALGTVTDRSGAPIAGVRLSLVDEYGNAATAVTKPGPGDTGRYDFPMGGPPRRFYMTVVDEAGRALSPRVEILHDLPPQQGNGCRWVDWRRN